MLLFILLTSLTVHAAPLENPFTQWKTCPKQRADVVKLWQKFQDTDKQFEKLSDDEKQKIVDGADWKSVYLKHLAPYLMSDGMQADVARECWEKYETAYKAAVAKRWSEVATANTSWSACVKFNYQIFPIELSAISKCVGQIADNKSEK